MKIPNPTFWGFSSSSANILLLVFVVMNLPQNVSTGRFDGNETDRIALLEFKNQISSDPKGVLNSWNHSHHHCQWQGIRCDARHQSVIALNLPGASLSGSISPRIGNLSFLKFIHLEENQFHGGIPQEVGRLFRLRFLNLSNNTLNGEMPVNVSQCSKLRVISLNWNKLEGKIPSELGSLKKLEILYVGPNNLTGKIPSTFGNLSSINALSFTFNSLKGNLPEEISFLTSLIFLAMGSNKLTGQIPSSIKIPVSVTNCSNLEVIDLGNNKREGGVPYDLRHLLNLRILSLQRNLLGGNSTKDWDFSYTFDKLQIWKARNDITDYRSNF
ncbi:hypothetical protein ACH5RR_039577 [Cinchona calisaya]|uniref:Leucine-rich repeat-containing N-terminal plant-type domain-containing protein n=1 Tax=Cinchona calisaya TaxID=153742 RepID=A0ABD2Y254_9GENT